MVEEVALDEFIRRVRDGENLEVVDYRGDAIVVDSVKGIVKGEVDSEAKREARKRRPRGGPTNRQRELAAKVAEALVKAKVRFKIVYGPREVTIRFSEDKYVRVTEDDSRVVGFGSSSEEPLNLIYGELSNYGKVLFLKPLR